MNYSKMRTNLPEVYGLESLTQSVYVYSASQTQVKCHVAHRRSDCFIFHILNSTTASDVAAIPAAGRVNLPDDKPLIYIIQVQRNQFWATRCIDLWKIWHVHAIAPIPL